MLQIVRFRVIAPAAAYESSSENTGLTDGKVFCLRSVASCASCTSKLLFKRSEGGHVDDTIELLTIRGSEKKPIIYHYTTISAKMATTW